MEEGAAGDQCEPAGDVLLRVLAADAVDGAVLEHRDPGKGDEGRDDHLEQEHGVPNPSRSRTNPIAMMSTPRPILSLPESRRLVIRGTGSSFITSFAGTTSVSRVSKIISARGASSTWCMTGFFSGSYPR